MPRGVPPEGSPESRAEQPGERPAGLTSFADKFVRGPSAHRRAEASRGAVLPSCMQKIVTGRPPTCTAPPYFFAVLGWSPSELTRAQLYVKNADWWGQSLCLRRRPFDTSASSSRHVFFEPFAPLKRISGPVFRQLLRNRGPVLDVLLLGARSDEAASASLATVVRAFPEGLDAASTLPGRVREWT